MHSELIGSVTSPKLTGGHRLARNSLFNLFGHGLPLLAALFAIPILVQGLGAERFGVLSLIWMVIGYFGVFDLGLGRALTQLVAEHASDRRDGRAPELVWNALLLMFGLGLLGSLAMILVARPLAEDVLEVPSALQAETVRALLVLAPALPVVVVTAGLVAILAAFQSFGVINAIRTPMAIFTLLAPVAVFPFSRSLVAVTSVLVVGRLLACVGYFLTCRRLLPPFRASLQASQRGVVRQLFRYGAWITVSNLISPLLVYLDRFVIGAVVSMTAVAYYTTPYEVVTRLLVIPGALLAVLFPAFAESHKQSSERTVRLFASGTKYVGLALFPILLVIVAFAREGLGVWVGADFAGDSALVLRWLALGVFVNAAAQVAYTLVQGIGRPDLTAKLHMIEFPLYVPALLWGIERHGIVGAAVVWAARVTVDGALLIWFCRRAYAEHATVFGRVALAVVAGCALLAAPALFTDLAARVVVVAVMLAAYAPIAWKLVLSADERLLLETSLGPSRRIARS